VGGYTCCLSTDCNLVS